MSNIQIINPLDYSEWDSLVLSSEEYSFFHSSAWARVLCESYHYTPLYFTILNNGKLLALLPVIEVRSILTGCRGVSLPFSDHCEPILTEGVEHQDLMDYVLKYARECGWKFVEFRGGKHMPSDITHSTYFYCHSLDLHRSEQDILSTFRESTKRNIKKATKQGVKITIDQSVDSINAFYRLNCMTRREHGLPPHSLAYFST